MCRSVCGSIRYVPLVVWWQDKAKRGWTAQHHHMGTPDLIVNPNAAARNCFQAVSRTPLSISPTTSRYSAIPPTQLQTAWLAAVFRRHRQSYLVKSISG
jgi:hypothetical protein